MDHKNWKRDGAQQWPGATLNELGPTDHEIKSSHVGLLLRWQHGQAIKSTVVSRMLQQLAEQSNLSRTLQQQQKLKQYLYCYCCIPHSKSTSKCADNKNNTLFFHKFLFGGCKEEAVTEQDSMRWSDTAQGEDCEEHNLLSWPTVT